MFTGIVEQLGTVASLEGSHLLVDPKGMTTDWSLGESVSINGVCLTVVSFESGLAFDVSPETFRRTALGRLKAGDRVNLERALRADGRFGGHIVQGHVDSVGEFLGSEQNEAGATLRFRVPVEGAKYLIHKGSITLDGVSLTVVEPNGGEFVVAAIPHTLSHTTLGSLKPGDPVNVEYDVLAKYVERLLAR